MCQSLDDKIIEDKSSEVISFNGNYLDQNKKYLINILSSLENFNFEEILLNINQDISVNNNNIIHKNKTPSDVIINMPKNIRKNRAKRLYMCKWRGIFAFCISIHTTYKIINTQLLFPSLNDKKYINYKKPEFNFWYL